MTPVWPIFSCLWPTYHLQAISCPQWALGAHLPEAEQWGLAAGQILGGTGRVRVADVLGQRLALHLDCTLMPLALSQQGNVVNFMP